jgi:sulfur-carrier protein
MIRVCVPYHLRTLAGIAGGEIPLEVEGDVTLGAVLDALEDRYPMLRGTIRDQVTGQRRAFIRYYACEKDYSLEPPETPLPADVVSGEQPFLVIGAIAGG